MVKSGLETETAQKYADPRVSHYRLAAHLGTAFIFYTLLLWSGIGHLWPPQQAPVTPQMLTFRRLVHGTKGLMFLAVISGAFVAGLDAGLIYNTFPLMGNSLVPSDIVAHEPLWTNFTENPTTVQFEHRTLGVTIFTLATAAWFYSRRLPLTPRMRLAANVFYMTICAQVS